jgi:pentatricopeptide repeat protein
MDGYELGGHRYSPIQRTIHHYNTIMTCFARQKDLTNLQLYYDHLKRPFSPGTRDTVVTDSAVNKHAFSGAGSADLKPNIITFVALFTGFSKSSLKIDSYWKEMVEVHRIKPDARVYATVMTAHARNQRFASCTRYFLELRNSDITPHREPYNVMVCLKCTR